MTFQTTITETHDHRIADTLSHPRAACSACGTIAACDCNAPYIPAKDKALAAIEANPTKSNRVIAGEIGVDEKTVRKVRKTTADQSAVEPRVGLDGKKRKMPNKVERPAVVKQDIAAPVVAATPGEIHEATRGFVAMITRIRTVILFGTCRDERLLDVYSSMIYRNITLRENLVGLSAEVGLLTAWLTPPHDHLDVGRLRGLIQGAADQALRPLDRWHVNPVQICDAGSDRSVAIHSLSEDSPLFKAVSKFGLGLVRA